MHPEPALQGREGWKSNQNQSINQSSHKVDTIFSIHGGWHMGQFKSMKAGSQSNKGEVVPKKLLTSDLHFSGHILQILTLGQLTSEALCDY